ncbi:hypothetical protein MG293_010658 [Ovis ammon polii]|uniref:Ectonucleotide pyrophosphatase/phosphodiesterase family member 3 n=1 Tax=Ovis ammon polii TaxID=230172 RepID=A0AAD4U675_OVIAM|nr:hypothetical protein MG293_010658 [Ovis ammon polii]
MQDVKAEATAAGTLKTPVCNQLKYGRAINFAVGRPDWNPAFALVQMTVYRGKTAVLTIRVFAKGLYPESHGIIDNNMYDVNLNKNFSLSSKEKDNAAWWQGQPIWLTAMYQGLKAGTYFWPGSDVAINDTFPSKYKRYNGSVTYEERIFTLLQWLDLPKAERPDFYTVYVEQPDSAGHNYGPVSAGVIQALQLVDNTFGLLMEGLKQRNLVNCVNIILLADHGMDQTYCDKLEYMTDYFSSINFYMFEGPAPRIRTRNIPDDFFTFNSEEIVRNLSCRKPDQHFKPYLSPDLPKRLHFAKHVRIDKVNLLVDRQWLAVRNRAYSYCGGGNHGYDNEFKSMEAIFLAHGPSFKQKIEVEPFDNIEVYNLLCVTATEKLNLPFGRPRLIQKNKEPCLLYHKEYVSGFDKTLRMPLWSSYTVPKPGDTSPLPPTVPDCLRADVRVAPSESQNCSFSLADKNITHGFLYPPANNRTSNSQYDALITSNLVPMYEAFKTMWNYFHSVLLVKYATERNGVNVVSGPIFDYDYDGHFDAPDEIAAYAVNTSVPIPTHYFVVLTSCKNQSQTPDACTGWLDVLPFVIPHRPTNVESCPLTLQTQLPGQLKFLKLLDQLLVFPTSMSLLMSFSLLEWLSPQSIKNSTYTSSGYWHLEALISEIRVFVNERKDEMLSALLTPAGLCFLRLRTFRVLERLIHVE